MAGLAGRLRSSATSYFVAAVLVLTGTGGAAFLDARHDRESTARARESARDTLTAFDILLGDVSRAATALQLVASGRLQPADLSGLLGPDGFTAVVYLPRHAAGSPAVGARVLKGALPDALTVDDIVESTSSAREVAGDRGEPQVSASSLGVTFVIPTYAGSVVPATTADRRELLAGWLLGTVPAARLLERVGAAGRPDAVLTIGGEVAAGTQSRSPDSVERGRVVGEELWTLELGVDVDPGVPLESWAFLLVAVAAALGALWVGIRDARLIAAIRASNLALVRETRAVAELSTILQSSLDLGEVLPAAAIRLSDDFHLRRLAIDLVGADGRLLEVFSVGSRADAESALAPTGRRTARRADVVIPMLRTGRTVGQLRLGAGQPLTDSQLDALRAAADLIAVATSNVELYEREQSSVRRLQELDQLKDAFLGTVSHELRTPITAISGFVELLCERWHDFSDVDRLEFLQRVRRNSASLGLMVDDLLDFARLDRQSTVVATQPIRLDLTVDALVHQLTPLLGEHRLVTDLEQGTVAEAHPGGLERVLANLLTNAAKFSPPASTIEISVRSVPGGATIMVSDQGPGIPAEDRAQVFTRFYRGDSNAARSTRGAGIGLTVVRELVVQMGGAIRIEDRVPHGTTMVVQLLSHGVPDPGSPLPEQRPESRHIDALRRSS